MDVVQADTLLQLEHRPVELGRIRTGIKATMTRNGREVEYPSKLDTFRLTSGSKALLDAAASLYGGTVEEWTDAPDEGYWQLTTDSRELRVLIPRDLRTVSQAYELWQGGTCERRCDGTTEQISDGPCICGEERGAKGFCDPVTRISLMLPDVPGLGVWRLDSGGWHAATSLPATIALLKQLSVASWIPAILRLEQRSKKAREADGKVVTHRFAVPVLDLPGLTIGRVVASQSGAPIPRLENGTPSAPPTAADKVAARRAELEAQTTSGPTATRATVDGPTGGEDSSASSGEPPHPAHAGAREEGSAFDSGNPTPASDEALETTGAEGGAVAKAADPAPCTAFHGKLGKCQREEGHPGNHRNKASESWA